MSRKSKPILTDVDHKRLQTTIQSIRAVGPPFRAYLPSLENLLQSAMVVPQDAVPANIVTMNSTIKTYDLRTREEDEFTLVYPQDSDILKGMVSILAPIGQAVLGTRQGTTLELRVPAGVRAFTIEKLLYQPEAAHDYHL
jgi:regulator of nucleoside diphosphate kinase